MTYNQDCNILVNLFLSNCIALSYYFFFVNTITFLFTIRITPTIMTIVATIILKLISSSSIIHPKKTAMTGLTQAKVLAKVAVVFLKIQKNPSHPVVPIIIRYMRESIDEVENFDTYNVLNSIIMPMLRIIHLQITSWQLKLKYYLVNLLYENIMNQQPN